MRNGMNAYRARGWSRGACAAALALLVGACDTSVTNPGPTPDEFLDEPVSQSAVIAGARRALSDALNTDRGNAAFILYWTGSLSFELNPAGSTGSFGITPEIQTGTIDDIDSNRPWLMANEARFVAEDGFDRFSDPGRAGGTASDAVRAELALLAGYANRLLGETFCEAVLPTQDPDKTYPAALPSTVPVEERAGSLSPHLDYFTRAEQWFTMAANLGTGDIATAALAGRAATGASLASYGQAAWSDAAADASAVADNAFVFQALFSDQDQDQFSALVWANGDSPYRAHTQWGTFAEVYHFFIDPADARIAIKIPAPDEPQSGDAGVAKFGGRVHWHPQQKYPEVDAPVNLSSGWEARLIEAEAALAANNAMAAVDFMNIRRTTLGLTSYDNGVSVDSAWSLLKLERQIELWLEARRLNDLRRWSENAVPGVTRDGLYVDNDGADGTPSTFEDFDAGTADDDGLTESGPVETMTSPTERSLCFPVGRSEKETNPNVSF